MKPEEAKQAIDAMKEQGKSDEELLFALYGMFQNDKIDVNELGDLVQLVGYELTDEFKNMSPDQQKTQGITEDENIDKNEEAVAGKNPEEPAASKVETKEDDKNDSSFSSSPEEDKNNDLPSHEENHDDKDDKEENDKSFPPSPSPSQPKSDELTPEEEEKARSLYGFK
jgi:hypothetical protein